MSKCLLCWYADRCLSVEISKQEASDVQHDAYSFWRYVDRGFPNTSLKQRGASLKLSQHVVLMLYRRIFGVPPLQLCCSSGYAVHVILWETYVHGKSNFVWWALDVFWDSSVTSAANSFSECSGLSERCSNSLQPCYACVHINMLRPGSSKIGKIYFIFLQGGGQRGLLHT